MTETLFAFDERNYRECQAAFRGARNQEYYLGDYTIEDGAAIDVRAERKEAGPYSLIRTTSKTRQFFRRTWSHIRQDGADVAVLWFVKRGRLCISHQTGYSVVEAGEFVVTKSAAPFFMECKTDENSIHEVFHLVVPSLNFRRFAPHGVRVGFSLPAGRRELELAEQVLAYVFEAGQELEQDAATNLVEAALTMLAQALGEGEQVVAARRSLADKRLHDILRFIEVHLPDPKLNIAAVAEGCGVSPRYLSFLLKQNGTPFSALVWEKRLQMAGRWLSSAGQSELSIAELAYAVGFKSPAHFSRMFKQAFGASPSAYRARVLRDAERAAPELLVDDVETLQ